MLCPECKVTMVIDEWSGWVWTCVFCDHVGRRATDEEIKRHEDEVGKSLGKVMEG